MLFSKHVALASLMLAAPISGMKRRRLMNQCPSDCAASGKSPAELQEYVEMLLNKRCYVTEFDQASKVKSDYEIGMRTFFSKTGMHQFVLTKRVLDAFKDWDIEKIDELKDITCKVIRNIIDVTVPSLDKTVTVEFQSEMKLGIIIDPDGNKVVGVYPDSQASKHKVQPNWKIIKIGSESVCSYSDIMSEIRNCKQTCSVTFSTPYPSQLTDKDLVTIWFQAKPLGIKLSHNMVDKITNGSQAHNNGVQVGWSILKVGQPSAVFSKDCAGFKIGKVVKGCIEAGDRYPITFNPHGNPLFTTTFQSGSPTGMQFCHNKVTKVYDGEEAAKPGIPSCYDAGKSDQAAKLGVKVGWLIRAVDGTVIPVDGDPDANHKLIYGVILCAREAGKPYRITFERC